MLRPVSASADEAPNRKQRIIIMPPRAEGHIASSGGGMRRVDSEASFVSVPEDGPVKDYRDYRVRKSNLIG